MHDEIAVFAMGAILDGSVTGSSVAFQMLESGKKMSEDQSELIDLIVVKTVKAAIARAINFGIADDKEDSIKLDQDIIDELYLQEAAELFPMAQLLPGNGMAHAMSMMAERLKEIFEFKNIQAALKEMEDDKWKDTPGTDA